jgi:cell division protein FtsB
MTDFQANTMEKTTKEDYKQNEELDLMNLRRKVPLRTIVYTTAIILAGCYVLFSFRGPGGIPAVLEKGRQIRELQEQNASLQREIEMKKERIRSLSEDDSQVELEVRKQLRLLKKNETSYVLQDQKR